MLDLKDNKNSLISLDSWGVLFVKALNHSRSCLRALCIQSRSWLGDSNPQLALLIMLFHHSATPPLTTVVELTQWSSQQIKLLTTSQLGRFCTDTHKLINSSNHNLSCKQKVTKADDSLTEYVTTTTTISWGWDLCSLHRYQITLHSATLVLHLPNQTTAANLGSACFYMLVFIQLN